MLSEQPNLEVIGEASNGLEVINQVRTKVFDVLLMDMSMPGRSGIELIKQVKSENPKLSILVLSMHKEKQYAVRALKAGALGYLTKETPPEKLLLAIEKVAQGSAYINEEVAKHLAIEINDTQELEPHTLLSDREFQIFSMMVSGSLISEIADELSLSIKTVSTHKSRILQKMKMTSNSELIRYAIRHQLGEMPDDL
jgi:DNA-binding NarL/FixJ family response regulator